MKKIHFLDMPSKKRAAPHTVTPVGMKTGMAKYLVFSGKGGYVKTRSGLERKDLTKNPKTGKVVSKAKRTLGLKAFAKMSASTKKLWNANKFKKGHKAPKKSKKRSSGKAKRSSGKKSSR